ncbi:SDR family oxidoreductase [Pseudonocardia eucalypti]|uniref:SDR family oxidoreductase n=1 Tax=Pseudonocardia eucalypti TaxID=648755 RepID=A0ABP9RCG9_9PSEU|nr:3-oxoacyl-[acyl-carrier protein] reductase [Pseudonocardia eucalypti]
MQLKNDLTGRVALVTAAAGPGIGRATAGLLAEHGATVVLTDRAGDRVAEAVRDLARTDVHGLTLDVTDEQRVAEVFEQVLRDHGRIDILVNNAGTSLPAPIWEISTAAWRKVVDVCLTGAFFTMRAVLPHMIARGSGSIVNIASTEAWTSRTPGNTAYHAAKAGLLALTRSTAVQVGPHQVRVNCVAPGLTPNPLLSRVIPEQDLREMRDEIPLGRPSTPEDIADSVLFLAGDASRSITGETIAVCGGSAMRP